MADALAPDGSRRRVSLSAPRREFLPEVQALREDDHSPAARWLLAAVALIVAAALAWGLLGRVEQVATAPGQVRPAGSVMTVNHPDGGRVTGVWVAAGDRVEAGQTLVGLDSALLDGEIAKLAGQRAALEADLARLQAEAESGKLDFPAGLSRSHPDLVEAQWRLYEARRETLSGRRAAADRLIEQRRSDVAVLDQRIGQLRRSLAIIEEQRRSAATLMEASYFPKLKYLTMEREVSELQGQLGEARQGRQGAAAALSEAESQRAAIDHEWEVEVFRELAAALDAYESLGKVLSQQETRQAALTVAAPAAGTVQSVEVKNVGQAVAPNEPLLTIVPDSERLVIEARVPDRDIGHVFPGQSATVKVRTFDFIRYGTLAGRVARIAADATSDAETGESFFLVQVAVEHGGESGDGPTLGTGMLVDVDFHVGERSILSYVTDRIATTASKAFQER